MYTAKHTLQCLYNNKMILDIVNDIKKIPETFRETPVGSFNLFSQCSHFTVFQTLILKKLLKKHASLLDLYNHLLVFYLSTQQKI